MADRAQQTETTGLLDVSARLRNRGISLREHPSKMTTPPSGCSEKKLEMLIGFAGFAMSSSKMESPAPGKKPWLSLLIEPAGPGQPPGKPVIIPMDRMIIRYPVSAGMKPRRMPNMKAKACLLDGIGGVDPAIL